MLRTHFPPDCSPCLPVCRLMLLQSWGEEMSPHLSVQEIRGTLQQLESSYHFSELISPHRPSRHKAKMSSLLSFLCFFYNKSFFLVYIVLYSRQIFVSSGRRHINCNKTTEVILKAKSVPPVG